MALVTDFWRARGWQVDVQPTARAGHATELARQAAVSGHRLVLAAGGDGTLGEVANGLAGTETIMAPLPVGTANSFAKELNMPLAGWFNRHRLLQTADVLAAGRVYEMDLGFVQCGNGDGRYWLLWTGTGFDGFLVDVVEPRPKWLKKLGPLSYALYAITAAPFFPPMQAAVHVDGRLIQGEFILTLVSNCRMYAGELILSPQAQLDDGLFEVWLFRGRGMLTALTYFFQARLGRHLRHPNVLKINGRHVTIHTTPSMPYHADGEKVGHTPLVCHLKPRFLRLLLPSTAPPDLFGQPGEPLQP